MSRLANLLICLSFRHQQPLETENTELIPSGFNPTSISLLTKADYADAVKKKKAKKWEDKKFFASQSGTSLDGKNENMAKNNVRQSKKR